MGIKDIASDELGPVIQKLQDSSQSFLADLDARLTAQESALQARLQQMEDSSRIQLQSLGQTLLESVRQEFTQAAKELLATVAGYEAYGGIRPKAQP